MPERGYVAGRRRAGRDARKVALMHDDDPCESAIVKRTLILGAGFSRAVSPRMPLTDELGDRVLKALAGAGLPVGKRPYRGTGFEAWLSRLAESQPDLTTAENLENRALFLRASDAIREAVLASSLEVLSDPEPPWWLQRFVGAMHYGHTTAVSFNYDLLVEHTLDHVGLFDDAENRVHVDDVVRNGPPVVTGPPGGLVYGNVRARSFRYLKLHGSVDSFWVTGDETGSSIGRWRSEARWGHPVLPSEELRVEVLPDHEPFIVPPAAAKSAFYNNPLSRQMWRLAAEAIEEADEVALIGYSLPLTDLVTSGMLADRLRLTSSRVVVVNNTPAPVAETLESLGIDGGRIEQMAGTDACATYGERLDDGFQPGWAWPRPAADDTPLAVGRTSSVIAFAVNIRSVAPDKTVEVDVDPDIHNAALSKVRLGELMRAAGGPPRRVRVQWPDGREAAVTNTKVIMELSGTKPDVVLMMPTASPRALDP